MPQQARTTLLLGSILLFAFAVRAVDLNGQSLFIDEFSEISLAKQPISQIIFADDSAPPLYPLVLKGWLSAWKTDDAARWLSVACGMASIVCVWGVGRRLVDDGTGLAAAFITAILPMHVFYSQFARCYSLLFLLVSLSLWLLLRAVQDSRTRDWCAFAAVAILGAFTHYYFAIFLATSVLVVYLVQRTWWIGRQAAAAYVAIGIGMLPLLWLLPGDLEFQKGLRDPRPLNAATFGYTYFSLFNGYSLGPSAAELQTMDTWQAIRASAPWLAAVGVVLIILGYEGWRRIRSERSMLIVGALALAPVLILGILSIAGGLNYNVRFVTWIMIAAAVWLGAGIAAGWQKRYIRFTTVALVLIAAAAIFNRHTIDRYEHEDLRGAARYLQANASETDTVYVVSDYLADLMRYYLGDRWRVVELPKPGYVNQVIREPRDAAEAAMKAAHENPAAHRMWIIYSRPFHGDPHGLLLETIATRQSLEPVAALAGVTVYRAEPKQIAAK